MVFEKTGIEGLVLIKRTPAKDERGYFARMYCEEEFKNAGIGVKFVQMNLCFNEKKGTLRGLHYQLEMQEDKVVSCVHGRIWDVCVDLRCESPTYKRYEAYELSEENQQMLFIPKGCAHGYLTLEENSQLVYLMSEFYIPGNDAGYRYDDPAFAIEWPFDESNITISEKDKNLPYVK